MNLKSIKLNNHAYHDYLDGKEVICSPSAMANRNLHEGDHVLVYRDSIAASTNIPLPKVEMQSEYIGIEGVVTEVETNQTSIHIKKI